MWLVRGKLAACPSIPRYLDIWVPIAGILASCLSFTRKKHQSIGRRNRWALFHGYRIFECCEEGSYRWGSRNAGRVNWASRYKLSRWGQASLMSWCWHCTSKTQCGRLLLSKMFSFCVILLIWSLFLCLLAFLKLTPHIQQEEDGRTALVLTSLHNYPHMAKELLIREAEVNLRDDVST